MRRFKALINLRQANTRKEKVSKNIKQLDIDD